MINPKVRICGPDKHGSYWLDYSNPLGRRRRPRAGRAREEAEEAAVQFRDYLRRGLDPEREIKRNKECMALAGITLDMFFDEFMECHGVEKAQATQELWKYCMKNIRRCKVLANLCIADVRTQHLMEYRQLRLKEGDKPATVNRETNLVRQMLNKAVEWERLKHSPLKGYKPLPEKNRRDVSNVTLKQINNLLEALPSPVSEMCELSLLTGLRSGEFFGLQIEDVIYYDLKPGGELKVLGKGDKRRTVPLCKRAAELIKNSIGTKTTGPVFITKAGSPYTTIGKTFDRWARELHICIVGGSKLCVHDLRRLFGYWFLHSGGNQYQLKEVYGHESIQTTEHYARLKVSGLDVLMPDFRSK